jgi:hypothetical protein
MSRFVINLHKVSSWMLGQSEKEDHNWLHSANVI